MIFHAVFFPKRLQSGLIGFRWVWGCRCEEWAWKPKRFRPWQKCGWLAGWPGRPGTRYSSSGSRSDFHVCTRSTLLSKIDHWSILLRRMIKNVGRTATGRDLLLEKWSGVDFGKGNGTFPTFCGATDGWDWILSTQRIPRGWDMILSTQRVSY